MSLPRLKTEILFLDECSDEEFVVRAQAYLAASLKDVANRRLTYELFRRTAEVVGKAAASINPYASAATHASKMSLTPHPRHIG